MVSLGRNIQRIALSVAFILCFAPVNSYSQDVFSMSLNELMQVEIDVASNVPKSVQNQPSTVTLITREQIEHSNAVYLMDILQNVPGFWAGTDTIGTFSLSFRGIWGMEAKILLIVDGIEQNELAFGSLPLGNRYPVSTIEQIEIIRGPGSVKYGGQAALAVIRVTSIGSNDETSAFYGHTELHQDGLAENVFSISNSGVLNENQPNIRYQMTLSGGYGDYSTSNWRALDGYEQDLQGYSNSTPVHAWFKLGTKQHYIQIQYDQLEQEDRLLFGDAGLFYTPNQRYQDANILSFEHLALQAYSRTAISSVWDSESKLTLINQAPWNSDNQYDQQVVRDATRYRFDQSFYWHAQEKQDIAVGFFYYREFEKVSESFLFDAANRFSGDNSIEQNNKGIYFQHSLHLEIADITYGGRYEDHDAIGEEWVPRFAITQNWGSLSAKFVYNHAFKTPQFDTLASAQNAGMEITKTEKTRSTELEFSYQFNATTLLSYNLYWLEIENFIGFNPATASNNTLGDIRNFGHELMVNWRTSNLQINASYSLFLVDENNIDAISIAGEKHELLGMPNHMFKTGISYQLARNESLNSQLNIISPRYACVNDANLICGTPEQLDAEYHWQIQYQKSYDNWQYGIGLKNILDEKPLYVQPYRGSQSPIPGLPRRLSLDIHYRF